MSDWLHNLPVPVMALVIFGFTYLLTAAIFAGVALVATGERAKSLKAISPGMLPVLGIIFGLFVAFTAAQVWGDSDRASAAVSREASALRSPGQANVQRELIAALEQALDARRQRIIVSLAAVNPVKWWCLYLQAACALLVIGLVHCDNRLGSAIAMGLFATGVATSVLLIAAHDRPFAGEVSIKPEALLQIMPEERGKS
ncbi:DUF4239 domain-containing protein [Bradyrhizobium sp. CCGB20]|uniref:bestrophin-like domain n=1 Tax=Bradyrhizobium sp. CCGB20 TaxID=2949633 RepID=UPI0020B3B650|nr:DUF4239 domain-containing protein [Bradyrhizobium sp. CCGB20]MCP3396274.1 DUF4239 domain-containing protein [Bradyrhizobium sp. CCGB20]